MRIGPVVFALVIAYSASSQGVTIKVERDRTIPLGKAINLSDTSLQDWEPDIVTIKEQPKPASDYGDKKELLNQLRLQKQSEKKVNRIILMKSSFHIFCPISENISYMSFFIV